MNFTPGYEEERSGSIKSNAESLDKERRARGLGWFSIGLGLVEIVAPRRLARFLGVRNHGVLFRIMGLREIASGVGIHHNASPPDGYGHGSVATS